VKVKACVLRIWTLELVHTKLCDMFWLQAKHLSCTDMIY
jgi:hypothetical protein